MAQHGGYRPGSGRKRGSVTTRSADMEAFARSIVEDTEYRAALRQRAISGTLAPGLEAMLFHCLYGKPRDQRPEDEAFMQDLLQVILKHATTQEARHEIRGVIDAHAGHIGLRVVK